MANSKSSVRLECRICNEQGVFEQFVVREMMYGSRENFDYFRCSKCGCLQILELPVDLHRHYPPDYYSQSVREERANPVGIKGVLSRWYMKSAALRPGSTVRSAVRRLLPVPMDFDAVGSYLIESRFQQETEKILDVGCGASPYRLAAFRRCGFGDVHGIDPFIAEDTTYYGIPVLKRTIEQMTGTYAAVMFHHSLEHVTNPVEALRASHRLLRPSGTCLVRIPTMGTYFWRRFGLNWVELDAPRHLYLMSPMTIQILANLTGFKVRKTVFDSEAWEIAASLQYEQDIPLRDARSFYQGNGTGSFTTEQMRRFDDEVKVLNDRGDGGRACFYLERV